MLQRLEAADRHAELLARLQILDGDVRAAPPSRRPLRRRAPRSPRRRRARSAASAAPGSPSTSPAPTAHRGERDLRRAHAVLRRIGPARHAPGALASTRNSAMPSRSRRSPAMRAETISVGAVAVQHQALLAFEDPARAVAAAPASRHRRGRSATAARHGRRRGSASPPAIFGSSVRCCATLPPCRSRPPASTTVAR